MNSLALRLALLVAGSCVGGCAVVVGTAGYAPCSEESCPDGSGGATSSTASTTSSGAPTTGSTSSGGSCFDVTVNVSGSVKIKPEAMDVDFVASFSGPLCFPAGKHTFTAECDANGGKDPPVAVTWGNPLCTDGQSTCTFDLQESETFTVVGASCP
jgi:hypothetical protein